MEGSKNSITNGLCEILQDYADFYEFGIGLEKAGIEIHTTLWGRLMPGCLKIAGWSEEEAKDPGDGQINLFFSVIETADLDIIKKYVDFIMAWPDLPDEAIDAGWNKIWRVVEGAD